ncbi:MAG: hypothetical protein K0Q96_2212 [Rubrobacteraceae bacterium]|nr:hypothetical protein [Rubrobacteraceae bacterium]
MDSNYRVREANVEDAAEICGLARELAETVGDEPPTEKATRARLEELLDEPRARTANRKGNQGAARGAPGRTQGTDPGRPERGWDRGRGELLDQTRSRPRRHRRRGADASRRRGSQAGRGGQAPDGGGAQRRFRQRRIPDRTCRHPRGARSRMTPRTRLQQPRRRARPSVFRPHVPPRARAA